MQAADITRWTGGGKIWEELHYIHCCAGSERVEVNCSVEVVSDGVKVVQNGRGGHKLHTDKDTYKLAIDGRVTDWQCKL